MPSCTHSCCKKFSVPVPKKSFTDSPAKRAVIWEANLLINTRPHQFCQYYHFEHLRARQTNAHMGILKCLLLVYFVLAWVNQDAINIVYYGAQHLNAIPGKAAQSSSKHLSGARSMLPWNCCPEESKIAPKLPSRTHSEILQEHEKHKGLGTSLVF